jgi:hypothetical protein
LVQEKIYAENDFLVVRETSKDKLIQISKDEHLITQSINVFPGVGCISQLNEGYAILFVCARNNIDNIKEYLRIKYGEDLEIGEVVEPTVNGNNMCNFFKLNMVQL